VLFRTHAQTAAASALVLCVSKEGVWRGPVARSLGRVWDFIVRALAFVEAQRSTAWTCTFFFLFLSSSSYERAVRW